MLKIKFMASFVKFLTAFLIIGAIASTIYFLWQRQPKGHEQSNVQRQETIVKNTTDKNDESMVISPQIDQIQRSQEVDIKGRVQPEAKVLVYSDFQNDIAQANPNGDYSIKIKLQNGLNLVQIKAVTPEQKEQEGIVQPIYVSEDDAKENLKFKAGTVKKIFQNTITISTTKGDQDLKTYDQTQLSENTAVKPAAKSQSKATPSPTDEKARVGDYLIAIGNASPDGVLSAEKIEIYRENKPTNTKIAAIIRINSAVKSNTFSALVLKENKAIDFTLEKTSEIFESDKKALTSQITKDKTGIIFYTTLDKNVVRTIYLN